MSLYHLVRDLPLHVESYGLQGIELQARADFLRKTTVVHLQGSGEEGIGEDVTYHAEEHDRLQARGPALPLEGSWTLHTFSEHLATLQLFEQEPAQHAYHDYRRWAFESAGLDLALRQARMSLGQAVRREARPVQFVVSMTLGEPPSTERLHAWLELYGMFVLIALVFLPQFLGQQWNLLSLMVDPLREIISEIVFFGM